MTQNAAVEFDPRRHFLARCKSPTLVRRLKARYALQMSTRGEPIAKSTQQRWSIPLMLRPIFCLAGCAAFALVMSQTSLADPPGGSAADVAPQIAVPPATSRFTAPGGETVAAATPQATDAETVEADVSTRSVTVTSAFSGTEIVIFGAIANSRQKSKDELSYDVVIVVEGTSVPLVTRRKSRVGPIWINTKGVKFEAIPSYYTISSTRPINEIAPRRTLRDNAIGFEHIVMTPGTDGPSATELGPNQLAEFRAAVIRLKQNDGLYKQDEAGVEFIGGSLFRATVALPANVPVGPLATRVYLFREGRLLADFESKVTMRREGLEKLLHGFAFQQPFLYGLFAVFLACMAGLTASAVLGRKSG